MTITIKNIVKQIKTKKDYTNALKMIDALMDAKSGSEEENMLHVLSLLVEKYEETHFSIPNHDPIEAIKFRMEQRGLTQKDIGNLIGTNRASEILSGKRRLSVEMMRMLNKELSIPAEVLLQS